MNVLDNIENPWNKDFAFHVINANHFNKTPTTDSPFRFLSSSQNRENIGSNYYYRLVIENPSTPSVCKRFGLNLIQLFKMDFYTFKDLIRIVDKIDAREAELLKAEADKFKTPLDEYIEKNVK